MFIAYIFSHQQLQLLGWGGNLFTSIPPPYHWFLVPVGGWFQGIISVALSISYCKCSSLILFFNIAQLSLLTLVLLSIHSGCQRLGPCLWSWTNISIQIQALSQTSCMTVSHLPVWKRRTIVFSYSLSWLTFLKAVEMNIPVFNLFLYFFEEEVPKVSENYRLWYTSN